MYTPVQVAEILQVNKRTVYDLIKSGRIIAKKLGKVYRIPQSSLTFASVGIDDDLYRAQQEDLRNIGMVNEAISEYRTEKKST